MAAKRSRVGDYQLRGIQLSAENAQIIVDNARESLEFLHRQQHSAWDDVLLQVKSIARLISDLAKLRSAEVLEPDLYGSAEEEEREEELNVIIQDAIRYFTEGPQDPGFVSELVLRADRFAEHHPEQEIRKKSFVSLLRQLEVVNKWRNNAIAQKESLSEQYRRGKMEYDKLEMDMNKAAESPIPRARIAEAVRSFGHDIIDLRVDLLDVQDPATAAAAAERGVLASVSAMRAKRAGRRRASASLLELIASSERAQRGAAADAAGAANTAGADREQLAAFAIAIGARRGAALARVAKAASAARVARIAMAVRATRAPGPFSMSARAPVALPTAPEIWTRLYRAFENAVERGLPPKQAMCRVLQDVHAMYTKSPTESEPAEDDSISCSVM